MKLAGLGVAAEDILLQYGAADTAAWPAQPRRAPCDALPAFAAAKRREKAHLESALRWALYHDASLTEIKTRLAALDMGVFGVKETAAEMQGLVHKLDQMVKDMDGDMKEMMMLRTLLWPYELVNADVFGVLERNQTVELVDFIKREGLTTALAVFPKIDVALTHLADNSRGEDSPAHPETPAYIQRYLQARTNGVRMLVDSATRTLVNIIERLTLLAKPHHVEAQSIIQRQLRDDVNVVLAASFIPSKLFHIKFRVMGKSILPITHMLTHLQANCPDYQDGLMRIFNHYLNNRSKWVAGSLVKQFTLLYRRSMAGIFEGPPPSSPDIADALADTCRYWIDFASEEIDTFHFYFPSRLTSVTTSSEVIVQQLGTTVYDFLRSLVVSISDIDCLKRLSNVLHEFGDSDGLPSVLAPIKMIRLDIHNKLTTRIHELFIRRQKDVNVLDIVSQLKAPGPIDKAACVDLHIAVVSAAITALQNIDSILDVTVLSVLSNDIMESVETKLLDAVKQITAIHGAVDGTLFGCRELFGLYHALGPSLMHVLIERTERENAPSFIATIKSWVSEKVASEKLMEAGSAAERERQSLNTNQTYMSQLMRIAVCQASTSCLLEYSKAKSVETLVQSFDVYCDKVSRYLLSRADEAASREDPAEVNTLAQLFLYPVQHSLRQSLTEEPDVADQLDRRIHHWITTRLT